MKRQILYMISRLLTLAIEQAEQASMLEGFENEAEELRDVRKLLIRSRWKLNEIADRSR